MRALSAIAAFLAASACILPASADQVWSSSPTTSRWSDNLSLPAQPVAPPSVGSGPKGGRGCPAGAPRWVLYVGSWYAAKIVGGPDAQGRCRVSYDGFGSSYDEWVGPERMADKQPGGAPAERPAGRSGADSGGGQGGGVPAGKYSCYTFDAGQLNYAYTDVVIQPGGGYSVGAKGGAYRLDAGGGLSFTGPLSNARGRYALKSGGKPNIDLIFNNDPRSSMTCPRSQ